MSPDTFRLYDTESGSVCPLEPQEDGHLRFYACGPTVYAYAHIGNFRSFLTADLILRTARALGWDVTYVSNVTDVGHLTEDDLTDPQGEDKMEQALQEEGERFANIYDLARYYTDALIEEWHALNMREPDVRPRATEHMQHQIQAVERLVESGHAYETEQGIYFSVESFEGYGQLSGRGQDPDELRGERDVVQDEEKRDPRDFALWKKDDSHLMQWHTPWGWGFPGWHIECSVMAQAYLGDTLDLHAGGEDLIFPHHECEIAQAESLTGEPFARHWTHTRFLQVEGEKMSKSEGNFYTVRDLIAPPEEGGRGVDPLALRLALISGQYRKPYNFTFDTLRDSARHVRRFREADERAEAALAGLEDEGDLPGDDQLAVPLEDSYERALDAMCDDLNTPAALAAALEGVKRINEQGDDLSPASARNAQRWLDRINALLGIVRPEHEDATRRDDGEKDAFDEKVNALVQEREEAREDGDYEKADTLRDQLRDMGVKVMDSDEGTTWRRMSDL